MGLFGGRRAKRAARRSERHSRQQERRSRRRGGGQSQGAPPGQLSFDQVMAENRGGQPPLQANIAATQPPPQPAPQAAPPQPPPQAAPPQPPPQAAPPQPPPQQYPPQFNPQGTGADIGQDPNNPPVPEQAPPPQEEGPPPSMQDMAPDYNVPEESQYESRYGRQAHQDTHYGSNKEEHDAYVEKMGPDVLDQPLGDLENETLDNILNRATPKQKIKWNRMLDKDGDGEIGPDERKWAYHSMNQEAHEKGYEDLSVFQQDKFKARKESEPPTLAEVADEGVDVRPAIPMDPDEAHLEDRGDKDYLPLPGPGGTTERIELDAEPPKMKDIIDENERAPEIEGLPSINDIREGKRDERGPEPYDQSPAKRGSPSIEGAKEGWNDPVEKGLVPMFRRDPVTGEESYPLQGDNPLARPGAAIGGAVGGAVYGEQNRKSASPVTDEDLAGTVGANLPKDWEPGDPVPRKKGRTRSQARGRSKGPQAPTTKKVRVGGKMTSRGRRGGTWKEVPVEPNTSKVGSSGRAGRRDGKKGGAPSAPATKPVVTGYKMTSRGRRGGSLTTVPVERESSPRTGRAKSNVTGSQGRRARQKATAARNKANQEAQAASDKKAHDKTMTVARERKRLADEAAEKRRRGTRRGAGPTDNKNNISWR